MISSDAVVVIGNGESRSKLDLKSYRQQLTLIGCNAIHRDINVDHIVCCDKRMVAEVLAHKKNKIPYIYTREKYFYDYNKLQHRRRVVCVPDIPFEKIIKADEPDNWGSGPYAVLLAASMGFKTVYLVGFDLFGNNYQLNNIYKNTQNYLTATSSAVDPAFWIYQIKKIFLHYPDTQFKIFNIQDWPIPDEWIRDNVELLNIQNFNTEVAKQLNTVYT